MRVDERSLRCLHTTLLHARFQKVSGLTRASTGAVDAYSSLLRFDKAEMRKRSQASLDTLRRTRALLSTEINRSNQAFDTLSRCAGLQNNMCSFL